MDSINHFRIAELNISIVFKEGSCNSMALLPSFEPFRIDEPDGETFFQLTIDDSLVPASKERRERIRTFDTGNGDTTVDRLSLRKLMEQIAACLKQIKTSITANVP